MLYHLLKIILTIALHVFFKSMRVYHAERIPTQAPLIFVSNHPSTFMDAMVIGVHTRQPLYFLVMGKIFNTAIKRWLFEQLHMIPLYRQHDDAEQVIRNKEVFKTCYAMLGKKKALLIFPEGTSKRERRVRTIKKGAAQLAYGAEAEHQFQLGLQIVPVGLNYSEVGKFRSELQINFGQPVTVADVFKNYDGKGIAINALNDYLEKRLNELTIAIESDYLDEFVRDLETIYKADLKDAHGHLLPADRPDFQLTKTIVEAVHHLYRHEPEQIEDLQRRIRRYLRNLERVRLPDQALRPAPGPDWRQWFYLISGLAVYLFGIITNYVPYWLPGFIAKRLHISAEYSAPVKLIVGIGAISIFYMLEAGLIWLIFHSIVIALLWLTLAAACGLFALDYWEQLQRFRAIWFADILFTRKKSLMASLVRQRQQIMGMLDKAKTDYLATNQKQRPESEN